jgi:hypothetical protein
MEEPLRFRHPDAPSMCRTESPCPGFWRSTTPKGRNGRVALAAAPDQSPGRRRPGRPEPSPEEETPGGETKLKEGASRRDATRVHDDNGLPRREKPGRRARTRDRESGAEPLEPTPGGLV